MPGLNYIVAGLLFAVAGIAVAVGMYSAWGESVFLVGPAGVAVVGVLTFLFGCVEALVYALKPAETKARLQRESETHAFIHCMIAMSAADSIIRDAEVKRIVELLRRLMNLTAVEADVRQIAYEYQEGARNWREAIDFNADQMLPETKGSLFHACAVVAASDGMIANNERARLDDLASRLHLRDEDVEATIKHVLDDLARPEGAGQLIASLKAQGQQPA